MTDSCICIDSGEPAQFYGARVMAARKPHICCECGEAIQPGEQHERVTGKWDGAWSTHTTCLICLGVRDTYFAECGWVFTQLWEHVHEHLCQGTDPRHPEDDDKEFCLCPARSGQED